MSNGEVIIMRGPSGAGKSTWQRENAPDAHVCSADDFWLMPMIEASHLDKHSVPESKYPIVYKSGRWHEYIFNPASQSEAHAWCVKMFLVALKAGHEQIVVDNTNIKPWQYDHYVMMAQMMDYNVRIIDFQPVTIADINLCVERNQHRVPAETVRAMCCEFVPDERAELVFITGEK